MIDAINNVSSIWRVAQDLHIQHVKVTHYSDFAFKSIFE